MTTQAKGKNVFVKKNVSFHEYNMHLFIYHLQIANVPKIISYNKHLRRMTMEKIQGMSLSDYYGEKFSKIPKSVNQQIRNIIKNLQEKNITYPDITGYNFVYDQNNDKIWIIDFEHCYFDFEKSDDFVNKFIKGVKNHWNPYFQ